LDREPDTVSETLSDIGLRVELPTVSYQQLKSQIVKLELPPNRRLIEQVIANQFGVSRTPVREALARLAVEGLVDNSLWRGTIVSPIRVRAVKDAQYVRECLEVAISEIPGLIRDHKAIVDAIGRRNPGDAEAAMRRHLKLLLRDLESLVVTKPDWFEEAESLP
jgi:DNA-binding GntR family transcriptional regulator